MSREALIAAREALINHGAECKEVNDALALIDVALAAPDLQAELDATNKQVEILSDALAESRREILAEREACAKVCEARAEEEVGMAYEGIALDCAAAIRARGETK
jgi:hypothetical protein